MTSFLLLDVLAAILPKPVFDKIDLHGSHIPGWAITWAEQVVLWGGSPASVEMNKALIQYAAVRSDRLSLLWGAA